MEKNQTEAKMEGDGKVDLISRPYQIDLFEEAVKQNSIIYLPTGSGKTYISLLLIKELSKDLFKPVTEGGKRTIFLVNTVQLVNQQREYISRHTSLECSGYYGDMGVDNWSKELWAEEFKKYQVLVMTSQIFVDLLSHGFVKLNIINLIIFDECHRAVIDHPMRQISQFFQYYDKQELPRILGLSGTLLNCNIKQNNIENVIKKLEVSLHSKIITVNPESIPDIICTNPHERIIYFEDHVLSEHEKKVIQCMDEACEILNDIDMKSLIINESSKPFQSRSDKSKLSSILKSVIDHICEMGTYGGYRVLLAHLIELECWQRKALSEQTKFIIIYLTSLFRVARKMLDDSMCTEKESEKIHMFSSNKISKLIDLLKDFQNRISEEKKFCCIIFVKKRFSVITIYHTLKALSKSDPDFEFLKPDYVIGNTSLRAYNSIDTMCLSKWNMSAMERFRHGTTNCLVATDVIDEGIDIPLCTLIIRYDKPMDIRGYKQSKGRARHKLSEYVIMLENSDSKYISTYKQFQEVEKELNSMLVGKSKFRSEPADEEIKNDLYACKIAPYIIKDEHNERKILTALQAVSLINKYCAVLYQSKYVNLTPTYTLITLKDQSGLSSSYQVTLKLPNISPFKDTVCGEIMKSITDAKRSAALKLCVKLHQMKELTDNFVPNINVTTECNSEELYPNWIDESNDDKFNDIGSTKNKRLHKIQFPEALCEAWPVSNEILYLHILYTKPNYSPPLDNRHMVYFDLLQNKSGFGILSTKPLSTLPLFPIYMNVGELNVIVQSNYTTLTLEKSEIQQLKIFHSLIFIDVLKLVKCFMTFDNSNLYNSYLVVPVDEKWSINWEIVKSYTSVDCIPPDKSNKNFNSYDCALVTPHYRASPCAYVVTQICEDLTPSSSFPTVAYTTYADYYKEKHNISIINLKQPMLEVKPISTKMNCIRPRSIKPGLSKRKRAEINDEFEEHLVPELCAKINFPSLYWLKATTLPSILHRMFQLLLAEELRLKIVEEVKLGKANFDHFNSWSSLVIEERDVEDAVESSSDSNYDDVHDINDADLNPEKIEPSLCAVNPSNVSCYRLKEKEPTDLYRNEENVQLIDIEYYNQFISHTTLSPSKSHENQKYMAREVIKAPKIKLFDVISENGPTAVDIMQALTSKLGHDSFDFERLETLGDSFLKLTSSLFLLHNFPLYNEGRLTKLKGKMIGNRNLYYCGNAKNIPGQIKVDEFIPISNFIPPAFCANRILQDILLSNEISPSVLFEFKIPREEVLSGNLSNSMVNFMQQKVFDWKTMGLNSGMEHFLDVQSVPDKTVADCVEALIGVYLSKLSLNGASKLLIWLGILPKDVIIEDVLYSLPADNKIIDGDPNLYMPWADEFEQHIKYKFKNRAYLLQAFTHPSYTPNKITECYQRLEFLGDAIIDFLITCYIYENCGNLTPGELTDLRSALVNNVTFSCISVRHGLHRYLLSYAPILIDSVNEFVKFQEEKNFVIDDENLWILLEENECNLAEYVDVPKVLGDLFESFIGAIYLDSGKNLILTWEILYSLIHKEIDIFSMNVPKQPIRVLHETPGANPHFLKAKEVENIRTVMVPLIVNVGKETKAFYGFGANKKLAKCAASKQALKSIHRHK